MSRKCWLKCMLKPGCFSEERLVTVHTPIYSDWSFFVDVGYLELERELVKVDILSEDPLVVEIPDGNGSTLFVRREELVPYGTPEEKTPTTDRLRSLIDSWRKEASWDGENKLGEDVRRCLRTCASQVERLIDEV